MSLRELLNCNLNNVDLFETVGEDVINQQVESYQTETDNHRNYPVESPKLSDWYNSDVYPDINNEVIFILGCIQNYLPPTEGQIKPRILEGGAGCGKTSKIVYNLLDGNVDLHCVENSDCYYNQMLENFENTTYPPKITVKATTHLGSIHDLSIYKDRTFDMVYTHTVLMHIPFISAVQSIQELARISDKYVCHVENLNDKTNCVYPQKAWQPFNKLMINYEKIYNLLGFETLIMKTDVCADGGHCIYYLGKRK